MYVAHSPYPDGSWRGIEKCLHDDNGALLVFYTKLDATEAIRRAGMEQYMIAVRIDFITPDVRSRRDTLS